VKCPHCGYFNLPGVEPCGQCGGSRTAAPASAGAAEQPHAIIDFYPPRARDRTLAMRVGERLRRPVRQTQALSVALAPVGGGMPPVRPWLLAWASVLPGLGQCLDGRWRIGAVLFAVLVALLAGVVAFIHQPASDVLLGLTLCLMWYSVWDAARHSFPPSVADEAARLLRLVRLGILSAGIVLASLAGGYTLLNRRFELWIIRTDQLAPVFLQGDQLMVRPVEHPLVRLRRGDVVVQGRDTLQPVIERVLGLPGDRIEGRGMALAVNGRLLPSERLPLGFSPPAVPFSVVVPRGCVGIRNPGPANGGAPLLWLAAEEIEGRLVCTLQPPERRRWMR
jgi:signal peptidase I